MDKLIFLQDMSVVMAVSAVIMIFCHRFHLPVVLGYLAAGMFIGPHTPPFAFVQDVHSIETLAELGVIFLLFAIGLEFSLSRLAEVGLVALVAATVEIALMMSIGFFLGQAFGWNHMDSLFLGAILSISSTTIIAKVLMDTKRIKETFAQVILGILVIEDLLAIIIIAVLSGIATTGSAEMGEVTIAMVKVGTFVIAVLFFGFLLVPKLLRYIEKFDNSEMMVITVLGLCFGVSLLAAKAGFSVALGAFLIGAIIAETRQVKNIIHKMEPIRDMFTAIFFVSVGMLLSLGTLQEYAVPILIITLVTIVGKVLSCSAATFLTGYNSENSLRVGLGLAQIGEFSFIIAMMGQSTGVTSPFLYPIAVSVSGVTALTTPLLMRHDMALANTLRRIIPRPIATASSIYTGWIERMRTEEGPKSAVMRTLVPYLPRLLFYAFGILGNGYGGARLKEHVDFIPDVAYWLCLVVLALPFVLGFVNTLHHAVWKILQAKSEAQSVYVQATVQKSLRFFLALVTCIVFILGGLPHWPLWSLASVALILLLVAGAPFWDSLSEVHKKIEKTVIGVFDQEKPLERKTSEATRRELVKLIHEEYPLNVTTEDFLVPFEESAINQPIRDLGLRSHTGATIVSIVRGDDSIPNPAPETVLQSGDVLMLMGDPAQIAAAIKYLYSLAKQPPAAPAQREGAPKTVMFTVPIGSHLTGKSLKEIRLRRKTGATILGLQKEGMSINNPSAETHLEEGDVLMLFGWQDQLDRAIEYLSQP